MTWKYLFGRITQNVLLESSYIFITTDCPNFVVVRTPFVIGYRPGYISYVYVSVCFPYWMSHYRSEHAAHATGKEHGMFSPKFVCCSQFFQSCTTTETYSKIIPAFKLIKRKLLVNAMQWREPNTYLTQRLRWSRGTVLAFGTQVCGLKPGRSHRIFPQHAFLRKGSKDVCPMSHICGM